MSLVQRRSLRPAAPTSTSVQSAPTQNLPEAQQYVELVRQLPESHRPFLRQFNSKYFYQAAKSDFHSPASPGYFQLFLSMLYVENNGELTWRVTLASPKSGDRFDTAKRGQEDRGLRFISTKAIYPDYNLIEQVGDWELEQAGQTHVLPQEIEYLISKGQFDAQAVHTEYSRLVNQFILGKVSGGRIPLVPVSADAAAQIFLVPVKAMANSVENTYMLGVEDIRLEGQWGLLGNGNISQQNDFIEAALPAFGESIEISEISEIAELEEAGIPF